MDNTVLAEIAESLTGRGETLAVAESVTSGLLMAKFSLARNATLFFQGGVVAYNLGQKTRHLAVEPIHAGKVNCVSGDVACQMAMEAARSFCSQWGIGITGYAVPVPDLHITHCFAHFAFVYNGEAVLLDRIDTDETGQEHVQQLFIDHILKSFAATLHSI